MSEVLYGIDVALFRFLNGTIANPVFDFIMPFITDLNKQPIVLILVAAALFWISMKGGTTGRWAAILLVLTIVVSDQLNSSVIKHLFTRTRPCHVLDDVHLLVSCGSGYSFPSSHAVNNYAAATVLAYFYRKWLWGFATFAGVVAFSRVSVGVHYPFDVVAGSILGVLVGAVIVFLYQYAVRYWKERHSPENSNDTPR